MQSSGKTKLTDLNHLLTCVLCKGYFIDATTIVECLHSFCRTCIVRYLQTNKFCPSCEVQVHKTRPLQNIRSDQTLQDIVYKLVPSLFKNEMKRRRDYYQQQNVLVQNSIPSSSEKRGDIWGCDRLIFTPEDTISVSLEYSPLTEQMFINLQANTYPLKKKKLLQYCKRYFNCPGALKVYHLKKLLRAKYGLLNSKNRLDILYMHDILKNQYTLVDLAYIYSWKRSEPLRLFFKITQDPTRSNEFNGTCLPHSSLPSCPTSIPIATPVLSMPSASSSQHPSPPPSPQTALEPNKLRTGKPNHAAEPNGLGPENSIKDGEGAVILQANGFKADKSKLHWHGAAKLHSATYKEPNSLEPEKSNQIGQISAKHKSAVLGTNNLDTEKCVHGGHSVAKFTKNAIPETNVFKLGKSLQIEHGSVKQFNSEALEPNEFVAEKPLTVKHKHEINNNAILEPNVCEQPEKPLRNGHSAAKPNLAILESRGCGMNKSVRSGHITTKPPNSALLQPRDICDRKINCEESGKIHQNAVQYKNVMELEKSMRNGLNTNISNAVVVLKKLNSSRFHKDHNDVISFSEFALKRALNKSSAVVGNTIKQSTGGQLVKTNASIPMPKLKSALKKTASNDMISSTTVRRKHSANRQLLIETKLTKKVLSKRHKSPGNGLKKSVTFSVNLVQDCSSRDLKRKLPDYFDDETSFPVNDSAMDGLIHLRKKVSPPKSS